jgi:hypothetical protein
MPNLYRVQDHGRDFLDRSMAFHTMPWLGSMCFLVHTILVLHHNLLFIFAVRTSWHKRLMWHLKFLPLDTANGSIVEVLGESSDFIALNFNESIDQELCLQVRCLVINATNYDVFIGQEALFPPSFTIDN